MNGSWIIPNNIKSLKDLYDVTKFIRDNDITDSNVDEMLIQLSNDKEVEENKYNSNFLNDVLFYNMVYFNTDEEKYLITEDGKYLIDNFSDLQEDKEKCADFFLKVFMGMELPSADSKQCNETVTESFKLVFKLLSDDSIEKKLHIDEFKYLLLEVNKKEDYDELLKGIKEFRNGNLTLQVHDENNYLESVLSCWEKEFYIFKQENDYISFSDEIESLLPKVNEELEMVDPTEIFTHEFIKQVIIDKKVKGKSQDDIERDRTGKPRKQNVAGLILRYYGLSKNTKERKKNGVRDYQEEYLSIYAELFKLQSNERINQLVEFLSDSDNSTKEINSVNNFGEKPIRKIYVGAPGTGKSYAIKELLGENVSYERIVFHPEYDYNDFVGQIRPNIDDSSEKLYDFYPGPLTRMLKKAINNTNEDHYLVIEEMTRGNCSAIFGNIFQLLDEGYEINDEYISKYIYEGTEKNLDDPISLPENLHIIGTINSSDQNVYPLDTAFKRRFNFEYIDVEKNKDKIIDFKICDMCWSELYVKINKFIINELELEEDKQVGPFFLKQGDDISKLFIYLWEDVNKYCEVQKLFNGDIKSLSELLRKVEEEDTCVEEIFNKNMFLSSPSTDHIDNNDNIKEER